MKIVILGGGISGLSAAWHLRKKYPEAKITLLEKEDRLGGVIQSRKERGFFFERGPRTFVASRSPHLLALIKDLGLSEKILPSSKEAARRFLFHKGRLRNVLHLLPFFIPDLVRELFQKKGSSDEESIYDFAARRFSPRLAEVLFDPMTLGVYAGDIRKLSLRACFPQLHAWEQTQGSLLKGFFLRKKGPRGLFTLKEGMESLIQRLVEKTPMEIELNCPLTEILPQGVVAGGRFWPADRIVSALPGPVIGKLTYCWEDFPATSLWVVSLVYPEGSLAKKGFGHLVPTKEKEPLLGAIWDSQIFPEQNAEKEVRLTAMIRPEGDVKWAERVAQETIARHLNIEKNPLFIHAHLADQSIPQFILGYQKKLALFEEKAQEKFPSLQLVGNYFQSPSVDACIGRSKSLK